MAAGAECNAALVMEARIKLLTFVAMGHLEVRIYDGFMVGSFFSMDALVLCVAKLHAWISSAAQRFLQKDRRNFLVRSRTGCLRKPRRLHVFTL